MAASDPRAENLSKVLQQIKTNISELSPIRARAAHVAVLSPDLADKKGGILVLLEPADSPIQTSELADQVRHLIEKAETSMSTS